MLTNILVGAQSFRSVTQYLPTSNVRLRDRPKESCFSDTNFYDFQDGKCAKLNTVEPLLREKISFFPFFVCAFSSLQQANRRWSFKGVL